MVAVLHQREHDVVAGKASGQLDRVLPGHVGILHALEDPHGTAGLDHAVEQQVSASLLDEPAGDRIGLLGILRRSRPNAGLLDLALDLRRKPFPHQLFGEVDRRRDQHEAHHARVWLRAARQLARQQQRQPPSHRRADHNLRPAAKGIEHGERFLEPAADRAVGEIAAGFAVAGIVEARDRPAVVPRPQIERLGLGALHVRFEAAHPEQAGCRALAPPDGNPAGRNTGSNIQEFRAKIVHLGNLVLREEPVARTALNVASALVQSGARALVAAEEGPLVGELTAFGGEWAPLVNATVNPFRLRRSARTLERLIASEHIEIVHAQSVGGAWIARMAAARIPVRLVTTLLDVPASGLRGYWAGALARGDSVITPSNFAAAPAMTRHKIPPERVTVIPRSID